MTKQILAFLFCFIRELNLYSPETQLLRASAQRTAARAATAAELRNQAIHDRSLSATAGIATVITTLTPCGGCLSGSIGANLASLRTATP